MPKLVAKKPFRYAGRALHPGEEFEASERDARLLKAVKRAEDYVEPAVERDIERDVLRQQAEAHGVEVDGRWGAQRLQEEIAATQTPSRGRYQRRDMRAEIDDEVE